MEEDLNRLAANMDAEVRAEQAEYEAMALAAEWRARSLPELARDLVIRGDVVEVALPGLQLPGTVVHVSADHLTLHTTRGSVDVRLDGMTWLRVARRVRAGGQPPGRGAASFRARMTEHQTSRTTVEVVVREAQTVVGTVDAAAADHLLLATRRGQTALPWSAVVAVRPV